MLVLYKRGKNNNEIQLTKNKMNLTTENEKSFTIPPSEKSHPVTDPLGKTVEETGDKLITS